MFICDVYIKGEYKERFSTPCISETKIWLMAKKYGCAPKDVHLDCLRI